MNRINLFVIKVLHTSIRAYTHDFVCEGTGKGLLEYKLSQLSLTR